jgi:hypothetical protein
MAGKAGLKAGLIGAVVLLVLGLLNLVPAFLPGAAGSTLGCVCCVVWLVAYVGIGVLGANFLTPPRTAGTGAGAGALAGLVGGVGLTIGQAITSIVGQLTGSASRQAMQMMEQFEGLGVDPGMVPISQPGWGGVALGVGLCCLGSLVLGAALGAIGGAIFGAVKSE